MPLRSEKGTIIMTIKDPNTLGDGPIQNDYVEMMKAMARAIDEFVNPDGVKKNGFIVMMFPFGEVKEGGRCNYISNAQRDDVVTMLKEQIKRFEEQK
jgi:hypothetical protein